MSPTVANRPARPSKLKGRLIIGLGAAVIVCTMVWDATIIEIGTEAQVTDGFSAETYGREHFPDIRSSVEERAVPAQELAPKVLNDSMAAGDKYGVGDGIGPVVPVSFSGAVGQGKAGIYSVDAEGLPDDITLRVQTGPAINGTDLRDATGNIEFGQFTNQIEYQDAGSSINTAMKEAVLADIDTENLQGESVNVTGVFKLINPKNWLVTPVRMEVQ